MERLYDFEEEAVESLQRSKKNKEADNTEVKVANILKLSKEFKAKLNILEKWEAVTESTNRALESRLDRLEALALQAQQDLAELKQMVQKPAIQVDFARGPSVGKSEAESDTAHEDTDEEGGDGDFLSIPPRRKPVAHRKTSMLDRSPR